MAAIVRLERPLEKAWQQACHAFGTRRCLLDLRHLAYSGADREADLGSLVGAEPVYDYDDAKARPNGAPSAVLRAGITGPAKVGWREGLERTVEFWESRIRTGACT